MRILVLLVYFFFYVPLLMATINDKTGTLKFDLNDDDTAEMQLDADGLGIGIDPTQNIHVSGNTAISANLTVGTSAGNSTLHVQGTMGYSIESISSNTILSGNTMVLADTSSDNVLVTLPYAGNVIGRTYTVKQTSGSNKVWIAGGGNTIGDYGAVELSSTTDIQAFITVVSDGTKWSVLSKSQNGVDTIGNENLTAWWKLDDVSGTTATDSSTSSNNGSLAGTLSLPGDSVEGQVGKGMNFNGTNDHIDIAGFATYSGYTVGSVAVWFKKEGTGRATMVAFNETSSADRWIVEVEADADGDNVTTLTREADTNVNKLESSASYNDGNWHHVVITQDSSASGYKMYMDGVEITSFNTQDATGEWFNDVGGKDELNIGYDNRNTGPNRWEGHLDDIRIYDKALSPAEVKALSLRGEQ